MNTRIFWVLAVGAVLSFEIHDAKAEEDVAGSQDHPLIKRYPGSSIFGYRQKQFDEFEFPLAPPVNESIRRASTSKGALPAFDTACPRQPSEQPGSSCRSRVVHRL